MTRIVREWALADAKARFSELVDITLREGVQTVTRRGKPAVVIVPAEEYGHTDPTRYRSIKEWLLAPEARIEHLPIPARTSTKRRKAP